MVANLDKLVTFSRHQFSHRLPLHDIGPSNDVSATDYSSIADLIARKCQKIPKLPFSYFIMPPIKDKKGEMATTMISGFMMHLFTCC